MQGNYVYISFFFFSFSPTWKRKRKACATQVKCIFLSSSIDEVQIERSHKSLNLNQSGSGVSIKSYDPWGWPEMQERVNNLELGISQISLTKSKSSDTEPLEWIQKPSFPNQRKRFYFPQFSSRFIFHSSSSLI